MLPAAEQVPFCRREFLADDVEVPVAIHVDDDRVMGAEPFEDRVSNERRLAVHILPDKPSCPARHPLGLGGEDIDVAVTIEVGRGQRVEVACFLAVHG